jgi:regulator of PEP synthase PpsR (kinase-PPPase family)
MTTKAKTRPRDAGGGKRIVFAVSDSTAKCAESLARAASEQFRRHEVVVWLCPGVATKAEVGGLVREADTEQALIVYTFANPALRQAMQEAVARSHVPAAYDPFTPIVEEMGPHTCRGTSRARSAAMRSSSPSRATTGGAPRRCARPRSSSSASAARRRPP